MSSQDLGSILSLLLEVGVGVDAQDMLPSELHEITYIVLRWVVQAVFYDSDDVGSVGLDRKDPHIELLTVVAKEYASADSTFHTSGNLGEHRVRPDPVVRVHGWRSHRFILQQICAYAVIFYLVKNNADVMYNGVPSKLRVVDILQKLGRLSGWRWEEESRKKHVTRRMALPT
jgi:hypothetical protein